MTSTTFLFYALKRFKDDLNDYYSERFFRIVNEVPTVLVIIRDLLFLNQIYNYEDIKGIR